MARIRTMLQQGIDAQFGRDFSVIDNSFGISSETVYLLFDEKDADINDAVRKYERVFISRKQRRKKTKNRRTLYGIIALTCLLVSFVTLGYVFRNNHKVSEIQHQSSDAVDMPFTLNGDTFTYTGQLKDKLPYGQGKAVFNIDDKDERMSYVGAFIDGYREGKGILRYKSGTSYEGDFVKNKFEGHGILKKANGTSYDGQFSDSEPNGSGTSSDASGKQSHGVWKNGKLIKKQ
jgi:hypothetical protein